MVRTLLDGANCLVDVRRQVDRWRRGFAETGEGQCTHVVALRHESTRDAVENPTALPATGNQEECRHADAARPRGTWTVSRIDARQSAAMCAALRESTPIPTGVLSCASARCPTRLPPRLRR